ncbi:MAG: thioredoxin domain-containing protein [Methylohalobius sp. ZOD2]
MSASVSHAEAVTYTPELEQKLREALAARGPGYRPRTRHFRPGGCPEYTNRLILEDSPYLLQHAHNPVDWHPWGEAAFEQAKREDKPVFLSIGYSTCHWCHVMEEQSFENPEIARLLNREFVPIKVDREQRPDVDTTYMHAVQLLTGQGGWPLSAFLTEAGKLFFGGTYFPPEAFRQLLQRIAHAWRKQRAEIEAQADSVTDAVERMHLTGGGGSVDGESAGRAVQAILERFDPRHGGFGEAPKFPNEPWLFLLVDESWRSYDSEALTALTRSLEAMAHGGIYDQIGGGFHRYSVDAAWQVPHFEKMLYNQAQLSRIYTQAHCLTGNRWFAHVARQTCDYVLGEMTAFEGGFYSATDADSEGEEGKFFVWAPDQIRAVLPAEDAELAIQLFGLTEAGNFEGRNVLHLPEPLDEFARRQGMALDVLWERWEHIRRKLYQVRSERVPPLRDDKVVTAWNGMMICALAEAGRLLNESRYLEGAERAAEFLWNRHYREGRLGRASLKGRVGGEGLQEDYACFAEGLLALYDAIGGSEWLQRAQTLTDRLLEDFWDETHGAFFMNRGAKEPLMVRPKDTYDGALPSGNSVAAKVLARLHRRAPQLSYQTRFDALRSALAPQIRRNPAGFSYLLGAVREWEDDETGPLQYIAQGAIRIEASCCKEKIEVILHLGAGWHVAGSEVTKDLLPTRLTLAEPARGWQLGQVVYPAPTQVTLPFSSQPLPLYLHQVVIEAPIVQTGKGPIPLRLGLQVCGENRCLAPETVVLHVPGAAI